MREVTDRPWTEIKRFLGPKHPKGQVCVIVSARDADRSFALGFMNGPTFRPQRYIPGDRMSEMMDVATEAEEWLEGQGKG